MTKRSNIFFGAAAALVAILTIAPGSGWLVRQHLHVLAGGSLPGLEQSGSAEDAASHACDNAVAAANPHDYALQLAWCLRSAGAPTTVSTVGADGLRSNTVRNLLLLRPEFDDQPSLQSHILRWLTVGDVQIARDEEDILLPAKESSHSASTGKSNGTPTPAALKLAEKTAARGETLDPDNGFFPTMLSVTLLAQHRDDEAIAALERAGSLTGWNDYASDEPRARIELLQANNGAEPGAISRTAIEASLLLPHLARIRDLARVMTALAVQKELAGDVDGGFAIRQSVARVGATMRVESPILIGSLVGSAITRIAASRPGGAPPISDGRKQAGASSTAAEAQYVSYLNRIGHPDEAAWFVAEQRAAENTKTLTDADLSCSSGFSLKALMYLYSWWEGSLFALLNVLWLLVFGGIAYEISRRSKGGPPSRSLARYLILIPSTVVAFAAALGLAALSARGATHSLTDVFWTFTGYGTDAASSMAMSDLVAGVLAGLLAMAVPLLMVLALEITSVVRRTPVCRGIIDGVRKNAIPAATCMLLLYVVAVGVSLTQERKMRTEMDQLMIHEGRFYASVLGQQWPGPVPIPTTSR